MAQTPTFMTRFTKADTLRVKKHLENSGMTQADFLRKAVIEYMERLERDQEAAVIDKVAVSLGEITKSNQEAMKASTDRTCAMLARVGIEVHALVEYFSVLEGGKEIMEECMAKSRKRIAKALDPGEKQVKDRMQAQVLGE